MTSSDQLRAFVARIERLLEERSGISQDIRDVYAEAKSCGYSSATIRRLIARRRMEPQDRVEADALLETYEVALGMADGDPTVPLVEQRPDAAAIALELITAEIVGLEDPGHAATLVEHVIALLDIRADISVLRGQEAARKKLAKAEGFDAKQIAVTVRWFEKVAKHGEEAMRAGEATFQLYRGTVEGHQAKDGMATERDRALFDKFAGPDPVEARTTKRKKGAHDALAAIRAARANEGGSVFE